MARVDDDAPWLAEAPPLAPPRPQRPWLNILIAALVLAAVVVMALLLFTGRRDDGSGQGYMEAAQAPLIEADPGPWKVPPADPQGLEVDGAGEVIHEAVRGDAVQSRIDMAALPEEPMGRPRDLLPPGSDAPAAGPLPSAGPAAAPAGPALRAPPVATPAPVIKPAPAARPVPEAKPAPAVPAGPAPPPAGVAGAGIVQIGAFSSAATAEAEWARVAMRAGLTGKRIEPSTNAAGKTLYRLRGRAADTAAACRAVRAAGGACDVVKP